MISEKTVCRFCVSQASSYSTCYSTDSGAKRPFAIAGASIHYAPDRPFNLEHVLMNLKVNPKEKTLFGTVIQRMRVVSPGSRLIQLDQVGLNIEKVWISDSPVEFSVDGHVLIIHLASEVQVGQLLEVRVKYAVCNPKRGMYFTGPDADYPDKPYQVWTQGQDEDSRFWFPTLDYPNQKATSEMIVTVPNGFTAVSNGALLSKNEVSDGTCFHYRLGTPHVTYLITLVVAEFAEWSDVGPRGLPVQYFVSPGREKDGQRAFGNTPKMIEAFEKRTGINFPYEKYSQVAVQDFIFGGMENTSATTQTDLTLHDERAHLDFTSDPLVSHELAHQWFGDLLTCRDWSHAWLNEGFATFMERVWIEENAGPGGGREEAKYYSYQDLKAYLADDQARYRRPIVCNTYIEPIDLFDTHLYQKGGLVVNLLRYVLGEDLFWKSIRLYLSQHQGKNVETIDLIRSIEEATGRNLRRLFDEWVFHAGYPEFEVSYQWHEQKKMTEWVIEQKQTDGASLKVQDGVITPVFHIPIVLELTQKNGEKVSHLIELGEIRDRVFIPCSSKPVMVRFDPHFQVPKILKFPRPKELLLEQLVNDPDCMGRIEAAQELCKVSDSEIIRSLGKAVASDPFWGVQVEAAKALAEVRTSEAQDQLIGALEMLKSPRQSKARRAVVNALAAFRDEKSANILKNYAEKDDSYYVEADSTLGWAVSMPKSHSVVQFLKAQLNKPSYREVIRASSLLAFSELFGRDISLIDTNSVLSLVIEWTQRGKPLDTRTAAVRSLGKILRCSGPSVRIRILEVFKQLSTEDNFRLRGQLVAACEGADCPEAIPILTQIRQWDLDGRVTRGAQLAIDRLLSVGTLPESVQQLKTALEKLEEEHRKLRSRFEEKGNI